MTTHVADEAQRLELAHGYRDALLRDVMRLFDLS
jgi:hypothetical protein